MKSKRLLIAATIGIIASSYSHAAKKQHPVTVALVATYRYPKALEKKQHPAAISLTRCQHPKTDTQTTTTSKSRLTSANEGSINLKYGCRQHLTDEFVMTGAGLFNLSEMRRNSKIMQSLLHMMGQELDPSTLHPEVMVNPLLIERTLEDLINDGILSRLMMLLRSYEMRHSPQLGEQISQVGRLYASTQELSTEQLWQVGQDLQILQELQAQQQALQFM